MIDQSKIKDKRFGQKLNKIKDLTGKKIGIWTVLSRSEKKSATGNYYWLCRCNCGKEKEVPGQNLRNGRSKSCGSHCAIYIYQRRCKIFDSKIIEAKNGCWIWTGLKNNKGYGILAQGILPHRFSYERFKGKIPPGLCVMHQCDTPLCCSPHHLILGTIAENNKDMSKKGRNAIGEKHHNSKLNNSKVLEIRRLFKEKLKNKTELAEMFGVERNAIWKVVTHKSWKNVENEKNIEKTSS